MKANTATLSATLLALCIATTSAQSSSPTTTTITIKPGCPTPAADVMVTRSAVVVPSCAAGNQTKPMIVSMSTGSMMGGNGGSASGTGMPPAMFTGAAQSNAVGVMVVVGGIVAGLL